VVFSAVLLASWPLRASDPIGIYCVIDRVVLEPNDSQPTAAQIWGAFALAVPRSPNGVQQKPAGSFGTEQGGDVYLAVQRGYLYYTCPASKESACRNEWSDLKAAAGNGEILGFGGRYAPLGTVRKADARPASPDVYPLNMGVVKFGRFSAFPDLAAALKATPAKR
jgi:hypothetical protein